MNLKKILFERGNAFIKNNLLFQKIQNNIFPYEEIAYWKTLIKRKAKN